MPRTFGGKWHQASQGQLVESKEKHRTSLPNESSKPFQIFINLYHVLYHVQPFVHPGLINADWWRVALYTQERKHLPRKWCSPNQTTGDCFNSRSECFPSKPIAAAIFWIGWIWAPSLVSKSVTVGSHSLPRLTKWVSNLYVNPGFLLGPQLWAHPMLRTASVAPCSTRSFHGNWVHCSARRSKMVCRVFMLCLFSSESKVTGINLEEPGKQKSMIKK